MTIKNLSEKIEAIKNQICDEQRFTVKTNPLDEEYTQQFITSASEFMDGIVVSINKETNVLKAVTETILYLEDIKEKKNKERMENHKSKPSERAKDNAIVVSSAVLINELHVIQSETAKS